LFAVRLGTKWFIRFGQRHIAGILQFFGFVLHSKLEGRSDTAKFRALKLLGE